MAISSKDIETIWGRYQIEGVSKGVSVSQYFEANGIPYHVFEKWLSIMKNNLLDNCWTFMEIIRSLLILSVLISFAVSVYPKLRLRTESVVSSCSCCCLLSAIRNLL